MIQQLFGYSEDSNEHYELFMNYYEYCGGGKAEKSPKAPFPPFPHHLHRQMLINSENYGNFGKGSL